MDTEETESLSFWKKVKVIPRKRKLFIGYLWAAGIFVIISVVILYMVYRDQIWYWPYDPTDEELTYGQWAIVGTIILTALTFLAFSRISFKTLNKIKRKKIGTIAAGLWATILIITGGVICSIAGPYSPAYFYNAGPYLTWDSEQDSSDAITVNWYTGVHTASSVSYGESPDNLDQTVSLSSLTQYHHIPIKNLKPNTTYYYQIDQFPYSASLLKQFKTAPETAANFTFLVWADPRENNGYSTAKNSPNLPSEMYKDLQEQNLDFDFSICMGDITARGVDYETWKLWLEDITTNDFASNQSHQIAVGNHERHDDPLARNYKNFYPYDQQADGRFFYSFNYGQAHFICLDTYKSGASWWSTFSEVQLNWLKEDLELNKDATFTTIYMHPNPLSSGYNVSTEIKQLSQQYGIKVVLNGHSHRYTRKVENGTVFITMGIGGNANNAIGGQGYAGYMQVDVTPTSMEYTMVYTHNNTRQPVYFLQK
jgi:calcineurin-like phosphoesterase family protein/purple acid phosphatase-like protein